MCPALVELIQTGDAPIDRIEIGPWFTVEAISDLRQQLPDWKIHLHAGDVHNFIGSGKAIIEQMRQQHTVTDSLFASFHITLMFPHMVRIRKYGIPFPRLSDDTMARRLIRRIEHLKAELPLPIILENMPGFPKFTLEADPARITAICEETDCGLLLDMGHARCAADNLNLPIYDYLAQLPLHRIRQIHAHSPRKGRWNKLEDAHEPMTDVDYEILEWLLERAQPEIITLEYWKDKSAIREQLACLREMVEGRVVGS